MFLTLECIFLSTHKPKWDVAEVDWYFLKGIHDPRKAAYC